MLRTLTVISLLAAACGGKDKAAPATTTTAAPAPAGDGTHEGGGDHHAGMPAEMARFHEVLRPNWHAEAGATRMTSTCAAIPQFQTESEAVAKSTPPVAANADTWTASTRALVAAVTDLAAACKNTALEPFDAAFTRVHDAFHALMKQASSAGEGGGGSDGASKGSAAPAAGHSHDHGGHH